MPILTQSPCRGRITDDEATILARWFAKTAANLNVSQPFRLLVDGPSRHALAISIPDRFAVIGVFNRYGFSFHLIQGRSMTWALTSDSASRDGNESSGGIRLI